MTGSITEKNEKIQLQFYVKFSFNAMMKFDFLMNFVSDSKQLSMTISSTCSFSF